MDGYPIIRSAAPVKSRQEDNLYSKQAQNCDAFIPLSCRAFMGAGDRAVEYRAVFIAALEDLEQFEFLKLFSPFLVNLFKISAKLPQRDGFQYLLQLSQRGKSLLLSL